MAQPHRSEDHARRRRVHAAEGGDEGAAFDAGTEDRVADGRAPSRHGQSRQRWKSGFEYRSIAGLDASDRSIPWQQGPSTTLGAPGEFTLKLTDLNPEGVYEYRAYVKHPLLTLYGADKRLPMK